MMLDIIGACLPAFVFSYKQRGTNHRKVVCESLSC